MHARTVIWLRWAPRVLGVLVCLYLGVFALDATGASDVLIHLVPAGIVGALLAIGWRRPGLGGAGFLVAAAAYAAASWQHPSWMAAIAGPLVVTGVLFVASQGRPRPI